MCVTLEEKIAEMVTPIVESMGFELWGIEYLAAGRHSTLRIFIDGPQGVNVDDCGSISRQISALMDVEDPISSAYMLEVSSPGMDRTLFKPTQYTAYINQNIQVRTLAAVLGRKKFSGLLVQVTEQAIEVEVDGEVYEIPFGMIAKAQVVPQF